VRHWWVNQNQTYAHEVRGGYLWSPQRKSNGTKNPFYETMREVSPGDLVFSFCETYLKAVGIAQSYCYECPKPLEFGAAGMAWDKVGWRVDVAFKEQANPIRPMEHMDRLRGLLPSRYSPLRENGHGVQSIYLTLLPQPLAEGLANLMGQPVLDLVRGNALANGTWTPESSGPMPSPALQWEAELAKRIEHDADVPDTEKEQLILARRGQGAFRRNVSKLEHACRVTKVDRPEHLRASHCKPWRDSSNEERLEGENGLLLTPSIDHLFDRGFITFEKSGRLLISPVADKSALERMGVRTAGAVNVGAFSAGQAHFLEFHQEHVFLARRGNF
jgi:putative restriction endonuclease